LESDSTQPRALIATLRIRGRDRAGWRGMASTTTWQCCRLAPRGPCMTERQTPHTTTCGSAPEFRLRRSAYISASNEIRRSQSKFG
jgi:hypothetical protein